MDIKNAYPGPTYRYLVNVGNDTMAFNSVSGLELSFETIEYKDETGGVFRTPGQNNGLNISLKRGIVVKQSQLYDWFKAISLQQVSKKDIAICLTNETGEVLVTWNVHNAFPTKLTAPGFDITSNEVAVEELSLMADNMTVTFH